MSLYLSESSSTRVATTKLATRMARLGRVNEFVPEKETISAYLERVEMFFLANDIGEDKKVPVLLSVIGATTYALLRNLVTPAAPKDKEYATLCKLLKDHCEPTPIVIAERYRFYSRKQNAGESIAEYIAELKRLSTHCEFEGFLEQALRDRLVCGMKNDNIRKHLLTKRELTFAKAQELSLSLEAAENQAQELKGAEPIVHRVESSPPKCYRCGGTNHKESNCKFKQAVCHKCKKRGHIKRACRSRGGPGQQPFRGRRERAKWVEAENGSSESDEEFTVRMVKVNTPQPILVDIKVNGKTLTMEVDTGAGLFLISESTLKQVMPEALVNIQETSVRMKTYSGEPIKVLGKVQVAVEYGEQHARLPLYVVAGNGPTLLGRQWLVGPIRLDWKTIGLHRVSVQSGLDTLLQKYDGIFQEEIGTMNVIRADLKVRENATPRFHRPRQIPFALKEPVERELKRLETSGILKRVTHSEWAAPIVSVPKKDGRVRVCGDYKVTVNPSLDVDQYPLPKAEDLFATLANGKAFTKLDLSQAYQQMLLTEQSAKFTTINTHLGLFEYTRLPFGIASAPAIFQRAMDEILSGIPGVICYIDDILITGSSDAEHFERLEEVLKRLQQHELRLKKDKCRFMQPSVEYLGHLIDAAGIRPLPSKLEAIINAPAPVNVQQLRAFLGLLNYYSKFVANLSTVLNPLNRLLGHNVKWKWTAECDRAFTLAKEKLVSSTVLAHYDTTLPIKLAADASAYGVGAVISHVYPDGTEKPVAFASRTLTSSERNYAQIEKEALALIYGVKYFHQYLYGRRFTLITDHKPLMTILGPKTGVPSLAAARLQRWALLLSAYCYDIEYKPTKEHSNADGLSRLPLPQNEKSNVRIGVDVFNVAQIDSLPVTAARLGQATRRDRVLGKVWRYTKSGWPQECPAHLQPYWTRRHELTVEGDCLLWGIRVLVPLSLQERVLQELHQEHQGVAKMKTLARSYVWWPNLDKEVEAIAKNCHACQSVKSAPSKAPLHPWVWPAKPWQRLHIDFAGPFQGKMFFVLVDAHSKWPEVIPMSSTSATKTIEVMRNLFSSYGLPMQVVSDNGPQFVSQEFADFLKQNGVKHVRSTPYHPSTNGLVERFI